ncbi:MAG TPA: hypothetical protein VK052_05440 [Zeimonas sp.]|nr:hypothetical protein [Zeimonas sp.]
MARAKRNRIDTAATVGYDARLWRMADALRGSMDAAENKRVDARKCKPRSRDDNFVEEVKTAHPGRCDRTAHRHTYRRGRHDELRGLQLPGNERSREGSEVSKATIAKSPCC